MDTLSGQDRRAGNVGYWCHEAACRFADRPAMFDLCGITPREVRYGELEERLDRFAALVSGMGMAPGERMAMVVPNRFEFVEVMFGAMRAGVVPVPVNIRLGADTLDYILRDAGCSMAVVDPACNGHIVRVVETIGIEHRLNLGDRLPGWLDYEPALMDRSSRFEPPALGPGHMSFLPYTSGSTGRPKGVVLTHAGQMWWIRSVQKYWPHSPEERALTAVPLYHKNAMAGNIKPLLHVGASVVILPNFEPRRFLQTLAEYRCSQTSGVPTVFTRLLQHRDLIESLDFSALRSITIGSAPVQEELLREIAEAFDVRVGESYGLTEGGPVMLGPPLDGRPVPVGSCGVPWPEGEVTLVGADGRENGRYGELWVRNPGVTPGYYNLPEVNSRRLKDGWLATGDLFSRDDEGFFYFRGRTDDMFKCGGENVYPKEVESLLLSHPEVADASVVPLAHHEKGEVPVAMVVRAEGSTVSEQELKQFTLDNGPAYAHPRRIHFVDALPLSGAAKIDRLEVTQELERLFGRELAKTPA